MCGPAGGLAATPDILLLSVLNPAKNTVILMVRYNMPVLVNACLNRVNPPSSGRTASDQPGVAGEM